MEINALASLSNSFCLFCISFCGITPLYPTHCLENHTPESENHQKMGTSHIHPKYARVVVKIGILLQVEREGPNQQS